MLTLEEIENISFRRSGLGGYKIEDVDSFVDGVIEKVRDLELANKEFELRIEQLNERILKHEENADSVQDAIITAEITAKKLVRDATQKAESILSSANNEAETLVKEAREKAEATLYESETRAETILNSALTRSASSIDENNRIIEQQKQHIIQIQSEVTRFRDALIDSYKNHLKVINSLPKADEFKQYQSKLQESYPVASPVTPVSVEQDIKLEADKAVEAAKKEKRQIKVEMINVEKVKEISEEIRHNTKGQAAIEKEDNESSEKIQNKKNVSESNEEFSSDKKAVKEQPSDKKTEDNFTQKSDNDVSDENNPENEDSNAEEIKAAANSDNPTAVKQDEPKPTSIDELDDGVIFSSTEAEKTFKSEKNKRQAIKIDDEKNSKKFDFLKLNDIE